MNSLLSDDLWRELSALSRGHRHIRAAIAYVTATHLHFRQGDQLICDASDEAIKGGLTSAALLRSLVSHGAEVYSYPGLHSKVAVIDDQAIIGSANLSENAGVNTCEACLLTDDVQVVALIRGFIEKVKSKSETVDDGFLRRIECLPVVRNGRLPQTRNINVNQSWAERARDCLRNVLAHGNGSKNTAEKFARNVLVCFRKDTEIEDNPCAPKLRGFENDWRLRLGRRSFFITRAIERCVTTIERCITDVMSGKRRSREEFLEQLRLDISSSMGKPNGKEDKHAYRIDGKYMRVGFFGIDVDRFICAFGLPWDDFPSGIRRQGRTRRSS